MEYRVCDNKYGIVKDVLQKEFKFSKRLILKLKKENRIFVNGVPQFVNFSLNDNDIVKVDLNFEEECDNIVPYEMDLEIVYEDDFLIILNKPPKIETHPTVLNFDKTLSNGLKFYFDKIGLKRKIRPVNRLDKDTSGLIVFAKNQFVQEELVKQMKDNSFVKEYIAVVQGDVFQDKGEIVASIARKEGSILERCVDEVNGVFAKTRFEVLERIDLSEFGDSSALKARSASSAKNIAPVNKLNKLVTSEQNSNNSNFKKITVVKLKLETGRTHQIRVHMKYIGHPLIGDFLYGERSDLIDRQALHSYKLEFLHPVSNEKMVFEISLADDILNFLSKWGRP